MVIKCFLLSSQFHRFQPAKVFCHDVFPSYFGIGFCSASLDSPRSLGLVWDGGKAPLGACTGLRVLGLAHPSWKQHWHQSSNFQKTYQAVKSVSGLRLNLLSSSLWKVPPKSFTPKSSSNSFVVSMYSYS